MAVVWIAVKIGLWMLICGMARNVRQYVAVTILLSVVGALLSYQSGKAVALELDKPDPNLVAVFIFSLAANSIIALLAKLIHRAATGRWWPL